MDGNGPPPSELGLSQEDLGLTERNTDKQPSRAAAKVAGVLARMHGWGSIPKETAEIEIDGKIARLNSLVDKSPTAILSNDSSSALGRVILTENGNLDIPTNFRPESQIKLAADYASTEAAVSALYTSSPDVQSLPPESFRVRFKALEDDLKELGLVLTLSGQERPGVTTRFYQIPGQQLGPDRKPILLYQQKILVVQDIPLPDGKIDRYYAVSNAEALDEIVDEFKEARSKTSNKPTQPENPPATTNEQQPEPQPPRESISETDTVNALRYVGFLAESVTKGNTSPELLRSQLRLLEGRGVARERLEEVLLSKGIKHPYPPTST
jgi:hypothetical protein